MKFSKMSLFICIAICVSLFFSSCAKITKLSPKATQIQTSFIQPHHCQFLHDISGIRVDNFAFLSKEQLYISAYNDLLNKAAEFGADTVFILNQSHKGNEFSSNSYVIYAKAYRCF